MIGFKGIKEIYFIGICGISMAGLAMYCKSEGINVYGSDINTDQFTYNSLIKSGITVYNKHDKSNMKKYDLVVYSGAIRYDNCEIQYAIDNNIPLLERSKFLGQISKDFKNIIAVSGSHGKTTISAITGHIFNCANLYPTIHLGGISSNTKTNFQYGGKEFFITEACEYRKSFLELTPHYTIINNIDFDHPDSYVSLDKVKKAFYNLARQTQRCIIYNGDNISNNFFKNISTKTISYGFTKCNDYFIIDNKNGEFEIYKYGNLYFSGKTTLFGDYNLINILASFVIADIFNIDKTAIYKSILSFNGVNRRFEFVKKIKNADIYTDYAHHPTEIKALLRNCKKLKYNKIVAVFQPHTFSRTLSLFHEFSNCFDCDDLILVPTYSARENTILGAESRDLYNSVKKVRPRTYFCKNKIELQNLIVNKYSNQKNLIILIGAGDINEYMN